MQLQMAHQMQWGGLGVVGLLGPANHASMARVGPPGMGSGQSCRFILKHLKLDGNSAANHQDFQESARC